MASSTIKKELIVKSGAVVLSHNSDFCSAHAVAERIYGHVVQIRAEFKGTVSAWGSGSSLFVGALDGKVPSISTYIPIMRKDSTLVVGWLILPTSSGGPMFVNTLTDIPQGVDLVACGTYICN